MIEHAPRASGIPQKIYGSSGRCWTLISYLWSVAPVVTCRDRARFSPKFVTTPPFQTVQMLYTEYNEIHAVHVGVIGNFNFLIWKAVTGKSGVVLGKEWWDSSVDAGSWLVTSLLYPVVCVDACVWWSISSVRTLCILSTAYHVLSIVYPLYLNDVLVPLLRTRTVTGVERPIGCTCDEK